MCFSVVGFIKPQKEIYAIALKKANCLPEECVFLDDIGINLKAAKKVGIMTIKVYLRKWIVVLH